MDRELKKNFVVSVVLHGAVFAGFFLAIAFAPTPRLDTPIFMEIVGGGGGSGGEPEPVPPPPPAPKAKETPPEPPVPPQAAPKVELPRSVPNEEPKREEIVIPKEQLKKATEKPKPKETPKEQPKPTEKPKTEAKQTARPKVDVSTKLVRRSQSQKQTTSTKPSSKPDPRYSSQAVRDRLAKNFVHAGPVGSGSGAAGGPAGGKSSEFADYYMMLSDALMANWDIPGQATPNMTVVVAVRVTGDGSLSFSRMLRGSGDVVMDESAVTAVNRTPRVPPPPPTLPKGEISVTFRRPPGA